ncbi:hypothetical protein [Enterococcus sp. DIV0800]|uniref:hypothetical protein n=1 Tax=unclassified Enterococcus TaxID=2608891 RepID=UPI003D2FAF95
MQEIIEQLEDYCDCLPEDLKDGVLEKTLEQVINLISLITCWTQEPCETFLNAARSELVDLPRFDPCSCDDGIMEFHPWYYPVDPDSFEVSLIESTGIKDVVTKLPPESYAYSEIFDVLKIDLTKVSSPNIECGCPKDYKLLIEYNAGYELLPECLLPLFCELLHVMYDTNNCDCHACQACGKEDDQAEGYIEFDDKTSKQIDNYVKALINAGFQKQLGLISLCGRETRGWSVIV